MATIPEALALAVRQHQAGRLQAAEQSYREILQADAQQPHAWHLLGVVASQTGRPALAVDCIRRAIALEATTAAFHNHLGLALAAQGKHAEAQPCFRRALELQPENVEAHNNLGNLLRDLGNWDAAIACYREAVRRRPDFAGAFHNLGLTLRDDGKLDEAVACYRRVLALQGPSAGVLGSLGVALKDQGQLDAARDCFRQAIAGAPDRPATASDPALDAETYRGLATAYGQLATLQRARLDDADRQAIQRWLSDPALPDDARAALQFGLVQVHDACGEYAAAAAHAAEGNAACRAAWAKRQRREYDPQAHRALIRALIETCTPEFFARHDGCGLDTELPVFVVGLPRSGTTLVEQILASHGRVHGAGELRYVADTFHALPEALRVNAAPRECVARLDPPAVGHLASRHLERLRQRDRQALRIVDKTPLNYVHLGWIRALFPRATILHCRRDLRDVAVSCWLTHLPAMPWTSDPEHLAGHFAEYLRVMEHWRQTLPAPPLEVVYEELVADVEGVARRIVAACGLEWDPRCAQFHHTQRPVQTASAAQVRTPIYRSSVDRWRRYEPWLEALLERVDGLRSE